ncbi:CLUMA_CG000368, isoform A [Clunio marinus]|uniref:CLUMA_CG000368, isoform A n=1 Tax=Clunio marinus TaxID=568069 RepID=A0A1J1HDZ2_9DIPT|nr:CLUMA_CG000368, isoform A [Clunio marinus]
MFTCMSHEKISCRNYLKLQAKVIEHHELEFLVSIISPGEIHSNFTALKVVIQSNKFQGPIKISFTAFMSTNALCVPRELNVIKVKIDLEKRLVLDREIVILTKEQDSCNETKNVKLKLKSVALMLIQK